MAANGNIPVSQKNQLKNEVISCIVEKGKDPEKCLIDTAKAHGLNKKQTQELAEDITKENDEE